jgi:flagellar protein FlaG
MSSEVITVSMITIACIICAAVLVTAVFPEINRATSSVISSSAKLGERIETSVDIIAEANESSYEYVWAKNTGTAQLAETQIERTDVFFGETDNFRRMTYDATLSSAPCWKYSIENDNGNNRWDIAETINITIDYGSAITAGDYYVQIVLYNGISDADTFSI